MVDFINDNHDIFSFARNELIHNVAKFKKDCNRFVNDYRTQGPMVPGLPPQEASDRLVVSQVITTVYLYL